jgi:antitoxin HigA-1
MKARPKSVSRPKRRSVVRLPLPTIGEMLREEFMKPLGITTEQIARAIPPDPWDPNKDWVAEVNDLLDGTTDEYLLVDLTLALDRVFGTTNGYFLRLWADCARRSRAIKIEHWLARVSPVGLAARRKKLSRLVGSIPNFRVVPREKSRR